MDMWNMDICHMEICHSHSQGHLDSEEMLTTGLVAAPRQQLPLVRARDLLGGQMIHHTICFNHPSPGNCHRTPQKSF